MLSFNFLEKHDIAKDEKFLIGIDQVENIENALYEFVFDGIEYEWFEEYKEQDINDIHEKLTPYFFEGEFRYNFFKRILRLQRKKIISRWFLITVTDIKTELPVNQYEGTGETIEGRTRYISSINSLRSNSPIALQLDYFFSWKSFETSTLEQLLKALNVSSPQQPSFHKLNVYNVGQGSFCAIANKSNVPLIYYDMGGGWRFFQNTYPVTKKICFTAVNTIILSHWDWDHLETARRCSYTNQWNNFQGKNWIVPKQNLTPSYMKFLSKISSVSNVLIWPDHLHCLTFWAGEILKCTGSSKNDSGLALVISSSNNAIQNVLHPADAAFKYIPHLKNYSFDGLVATHHGANFDDNNSDIPATTNKSYIAYSYANTRYGHPKKDAVKAYEKAGWKTRLDTIHEDISFTTINILDVPCSLSCDLTIKQIF